MTNIILIIQIKVIILLIPFLLSVF